MNRLNQFFTPKAALLIETKRVSLRLLLFATLLCMTFTTFVKELVAASYSTSTKQLAWFYKPPSNTTLDVLAKNFKMFILTKGDEKTRDSLKAKGVTCPIVQYLRADAIQNPGSCSATPNGNQVADKAGDYCYISTNHPDWFLLDKYGKRMFDSDGYAMMDPGSTGWRSFFLSRAKVGQEQLGWYGVFLDNVEGSLGKRQQYNQLPAKYTSDSSYQSVIKGMLAYLYNGYFAPKGRPMQANIVSLRDSTTYFSYLTYLSGSMDEAFAVDWHTGYLTTTKWLDDLTRAEKGQSMGKQLILVSQGDKTATSRQQFSYCSYLLISNGKAGFRYGYAHYYTQAWLYSDYNVDLGSPVNSRYLKSGVWYRDFQKGRVKVDPAAHTSSISIY